MNGEWGKSEIRVKSTTEGIYSELTFQNLCCCRTEWKEGSVRARSRQLSRANKMEGIPDL